MICSGGMELRCVTKVGDFGFEMALEIIGSYLGEYLLGAISERGSTASFRRETNFQ